MNDVKKVEIEQTLSSLVKLALENQLCDSDVASKKDVESKMEAFNARVQEYQRAGLKWDVIGFPLTCNVVKNRMYLRYPDNQWVRVDRRVYGRRRMRTLWKEYKTQIRISWSMDGYKQA